MGENEQMITDALIGEMDAADTGSAPTGTAPMHGGSETVLGTNYGPGSAPLHGGGEFGSLHGGTGTRQLSAGFNVNSPDSYAAPARPTKLELQAARRATAASLRAFGTGYVEPAGGVSGLDTSHLDRALQIVVEREEKASRRRAQAAENDLHNMLNPEERKNQ